MFYIILFILLVILIYRKNVVITITEKKKDKKNSTKKYTELIIIIVLLIILYFVYNFRLIQKLHRFLTLGIMNLKKIQKLNISDRLNLLIDKKLNSTINNLIKETK